MFKESQRCKNSLAIQQTCAALAALATGFPFPSGETTSFADFEGVAAFVFPELKVFNSEVVILFPAGMAFKV